MTQGKFVVATDFLMTGPATSKIAWFTGNFTSARNSVTIA